MASFTQRGKTFAVRAVKPRVSPQTWNVLRDPLQRKRPVAAPRPTQPPVVKARPSLTELAQKYRTDKYGMHFYTEHYQRHLEYLRDREFTLLELGIGGYRMEGRGGASLRMWEEFFPRARIVGLDIEDKSFVDGGRIRTYQGSQVDPAVLRRIQQENGSLTVVIDDGSHRPEHIRESFALLFPSLAADGVYAIEDTQTSYWPTFGGSTLLNDPNTSMSLAKDLLDGLNWEEFTDEEYQPTYADKHIRSLHAYHNLVILEKGNNVEGTNRTRGRRTVDEGDPYYSDAPPVAAQRAPYSVQVDPI